MEKARVDRRAIVSGRATEEQRRIGVVLRDRVCVHGVVGPIFHRPVPAFLAVTPEVVSGNNSIGIKDDLLIGALEMKAADRSRQDMTYAMLDFGLHRACSAVARDGIVPRGETRGFKDRHPSICDRRSM